jgi:uncharacterized protein (TIGR02611 family)
MNKAMKQAKRVGVGIFGGVVLLVGLVAIPYPGPGWLIVFAGLAILATEFAWAQHILDITKDKYESWQRWIARQKPAVKFIFWLLTSVVVVITIWLLNGYGLLNDWFNLGWDWLRSPLFR